MVQNFAKTLLDVADNLGRAASVVKDSFSKVDASKDTAGAVPLLETLLKGVEMTEKQLAEVCILHPGNAMGTTKLYPKCTPHEVLHLDWLGVGSTQSFQSTPSQSKCDTS